MKEKKKKQNKEMTVLLYQDTAANCLGDTGRNNGAIIHN